MVSAYLTRQTSRQVRQPTALLVIAKLKLTSGASSSGLFMWKIVGSIHGALFVIFCVALLRTMLVARWPLPRGAIVFIASLLPFGPFFVDRRMAEYEAEFQAGNRA